MASTIASSTTVSSTNLIFLGVFLGAFYLFADSTNDGSESFVSAADILCYVLNDSSWVHPFHWMSFVNGCFRVETNPSDQMNCMNGCPPCPKRPDVL